MHAQIGNHGKKQKTKKPTNTLYADGFAWGAVVLGKDLTLRGGVLKTLKLAGH